MKRGQAYTFLFYLILALIFFIPTVSWASQFFKFGDKSADSYAQLVGIISSIKPGEIESHLLYLNPNYLIVGFTKDSEMVKSIVFETQVSGNMIKPPQCEKGSSCICICKEGVDVKGNDILCTKSIICNKLQNIDFFEKRTLSDIPIKGVAYDQAARIAPARKTWINGFFITNSNNNDVINRIYAVQSKDSLSLRNPVPIYIQRYKNFVNVCFDRNCITDEMIDAVNKKEAINEFTRLKEAYNACKSSSQVECSAFTLNLPQKYKIYYKRLSIFSSAAAAPGELYLIKTEIAESQNIRDQINGLTVQSDGGEKSFFAANLKSFGGSTYTSGLALAKIYYEDGFLPTSFTLKKQNDFVVIEPSP